MTLGRVHARWVGFVLVVLAGAWLELSPWGARVTGVVLDVQLRALDFRGAGPVAPDLDGTDVDAGAGTDLGTDPTTPPASASRPLSRTVAMSLVVIGALVWWESRLLGWALASSLTALAALLAVSTMMLPRGVQVPTAGPGLAIVAGFLGRRVLEAVIAFRDHRRSRGAAESGG